MHQPTISLPPYPSATGQPQSQPLLSISIGTGPFDLETLFVSLHSSPVTTALQFPRRRSTLLSSCSPLPRRSPSRLFSLPLLACASDSPVHSSSSDDFAAFLYAELNSNSSASSPDEEDEDDESKDEEAEDDIELEGKRVKRCKVEMSGNIQDHVSISHETLEHRTDKSLKMDICTHPRTFERMCALCGKMLEEEPGVALGYIHKGLRFTNDEIVRLGNKDTENLLRHRKLILVLDLDHTLLNSTLLAHLTPEEEYLKSQTDSLQDVSRGDLFKLDFIHMMTKLRPFVRTFFKEASEMFEMHIYTMGHRSYALEMARLLDPNDAFPTNLYICVWPEHKDNLILMERYHFFKSSPLQFGYNCKSLLELKDDGALAYVLKALKQVHSMFFDELGGDLAGRDVRQVLKMVRKEVLKGCKIVFSRVFPATRYQAADHHLWKMAEQLGATCMTELDPSVTLVVSTDVGTEKSRWALKEKKFLVHPRWIETVNFLWHKLPEENFPVIPTKTEE
ncbi:hypothetical protein LWI28_000437 [Acer negundo]|uniref:protein-serine/threonine phosphatase n=1 Tax=Acer negundo TaxID=4023 RepID=A0AAD5J2G3_ACENE|nr:hypothetical protein LWI28_000437 [Acer negundo]